MIVCEGPDGAGKTTLCAWICDKYDLKMGVRGTQNRDELYKVTRLDTWYAVYEELRCTEPPKVWDRLGPWSDPVYAPVQGRQRAFTSRELDVVEAFMHSLRCPLILCLPPITEVKMNIRKQHQMQGVEENIVRIWNVYVRLAPLATVVYDYTVHTPEQVIAPRIDSYLDNRKERECYSSSTHATSASAPSPQAV